MIVLFNMNNYLGGGEVLLLRILDSLSQESKTCSFVITSKNSYIASSISNKENLLELENKNYHYLNKEDQIKTLETISLFLSKQSNLIIVSFCLRDLYTVVDLSKSINFTPIHLLLHPLDHLCCTQNILMKLMGSMGFQFFLNSNIKERNKKILTVLNNNNSLVSMNENVSNRIKYDFSMQVKHIIPLPAYQKNTCLEQKKLTNQKKIVWLGRIVDFKLPSIISMIDFIENNEDYSFHIIGYGEESKIYKYINSKKKNTIKKRIFFEGKIKHSCLQEKLQNYDIGYGMGTSIIELAAAQLPTIVATASPNFKRFKTPICSGLSYEADYGNVGDELYDPSKKTRSLKLISSCIKKIEDNYTLEQEKCFEHIQNTFSIEDNMNAYKALFLSLNHKINIFESIASPKPSFLKRLLFFISSKF